MITLGITGRSGCGKSTVTAVFAAHGVPLADADQLSREILLPGSPLLPQLAARFGGEILHPDGTLNRRLLAAFDEALYDADIPLYVPLECGRTLSHAILTVSTAISGGSLTEYISSLQGIYSAARIAAFLQPVSQDFTLPSPTPNGISLSAAARAALLAQTGAQPFFSRELCAKYFTYMNADGQAHFVLYDDDSTLAAKLAQLAGCGVQNVFALFPDAAGLLKPQT